MKIVSFNEISKCMRGVNKLLTSGVYTLYGRGKDSVVINNITPGDSLADLYNTQYGQYMFEFGNLTIGEGVDIPVVNDYQFAFIKVNGTLLVNGHLHMDGRGGSFSDTQGTIIDVGGVPTYTNVSSLHSFASYNLTPLSDTSSCTTDLWFRLTNYGAQETFFLQNTALTGAGGNGYTKHYYEYDEPIMVEREPKVDPHQRQWGTWRGFLWVWKPGGLEAYEAAKAANSDLITGEYQVRGSQSVSYLSGGGSLSQLSIPTEDEGMVCGGGGGGFISLFCETLSNDGEKFTEGDDRYALNIHSNGGTSIYTDGTTVRGGGCLIIAARHIVIGPNGSITADGGNGNGLMSLLNRNPYKNLYVYNNGNPAVYTNTFSGGAGYAQYFIK